MRLVVMIKFFKIINTKHIFIWSVVSVLFFTCLYAMCYDEEFTTWIETYYKPPTNKIMYMTDLFDNISVNNGNDKVVHKQQFVDIPIFKENDIVYILHKHDSRSSSSDAEKLRRDIYDLTYSVSKGDSKGLLRHEFVNIPLNMKYIGDYVSPNAQKLNYTLIAQNKKYKFGILDRLYFSTITQATVGYGDVVPASKRVRVLAGLQAFSTLVILSLQ